MVVTINGHWSKHALNSLNKQKLVAWLSYSQFAHNERFEAFDYSQTNSNQNEEDLVTFKVTNLRLWLVTTLLVSQPSVWVMTLYHNILPDFPDKHNIIQIHNNVVWDWQSQKVTEACEGISGCARERKNDHICIYPLIHTTYNKTPKIACRVVDHIMLLYKLMRH